MGYSPQQVHQCRHASFVANHHFRITPSPSQPGTHKGHVGFKRGPLGIWPVSKPCTDTAGKGFAPAVFSTAQLEPRRHSRAPRNHWLLPATREFSCLGCSGTEPATSQKYSRADDQPAKRSGRRDRERRRSLEKCVGGDPTGMYICMSQCIAVNLALVCLPRTQNQGCLPRSRWCRQPGDTQQGMCPSVHIFR